MDFNKLHQHVDELYRIGGQTEMESAVALWYLKKAMAVSCQEIRRDAINKANLLDPRNSHLFMAKYHHRRNHFTEALQHYLNAFHSNPLDRSLWSVTGEYLLRYGTADKVLEFYNQLLKADKYNDNTRFVLDCYAYFEQLKQEIGSTLFCSEHDGCGLDKLLMQVVFWGPRYTDIFMDYMLPALCAPGNLPAIKKNYEMHFILFTDTHGAARLQEDRFFSEIKKYVRPHIITLSESHLDYAKQVAAKNGGGWTIPATMITNAAHYAVLEYGRLMGADVLNFAPDHILSDHCMAEMHRSLTDQVHVLAGPGFRLYDDPALLKQIESRYRKDHGTLEIAPQEMTKLLVENLPEENFVHAEQFSKYPIYLCWRVEGVGVIAHVNHYHPWVVRGRGLTGEVQLSLDPLDGNFLNRHLADKNAIAFAPLAMLCFDLGTNPLCLPTDSNRFNPQKVAQWVRPFLSPVHEQYFRNTLCYPINEISNSIKWHKTESEADQLVKEIIVDAKQV